MRVACVGNINNMLFVLCRYLRDAGLDCDLLLFNNEMDHFLPSNDSFDENYTSYTKVLEWGDINSFDSTSSEKITSDLQSYDFIIATQAPAFFHKAGINIDVYFPAGGDLFHTPFIKDNLGWYAKLRQPKLIKYLVAHKKGIQQSIVINQEPFSEPYKSSLVKLEAKNVYYFGCPLVYQNMYRNDGTSSYSSQMKQRFNEIRKKSDLMVFHQARQLWKVKDEGSHPSKGSNNLIEGFAKSVVANPTLSFSLALLEYGDVNESKELIKNLGIKEHVYWMEKMPRKELMYGLSIADFGCGEFDPGCIGGLTTWESLAVGTCLLHYMNESMVKFDEFTKVYPFINVKDPNKIAAVLNNFITQPDRYKAIGESGASWYQENFQKICLNKWIELIEVKRRLGIDGLKEFVNSKTTIINV